MRIKRIVAVFVLVCFASLAFAQKQNVVKKKGYKIDVKMKSTPPDTMLYLISYYGEYRLKIDSAISKPTQRNRFVFESDTTLSSGIYLIVNQRKIQLVEFLIDKSQQLSLEFDTLNAISSVVVKNSPETQLFYDYLKKLTTKQDSVREIEKVLDYAQQTQNKELFDLKYPEYVKQINLVDAYTLEFIKNHPNDMISKVLKMNVEIDIPPLPSLPNGGKDSTWGWQYYKNHFWDNTDLKDARIYRTPVFGTKIKGFFDQVVPQHPDSLSAEIDKFLQKTKPSPEMSRLMFTWFIDRYYQSQTVNHEAVFVHLVERYLLSGEVPWLSENMIRIFSKRAAQLKSILIGSKIPELVMPDTADVLLSNYHTGSMYTVMWFWDPDCTHCTVETPKLLDFYHKYGQSMGVEVYAVSLDADLDRWKSYIKENNLDWINVGGSRANIDYAMAFDIIATPIIYVFDHNKRIIGKNIPVEDLKGLIEQYEKLFNQKK